MDCCVCKRQAPTSQTCGSSGCPSSHRHIRAVPVTADGVVADKTCYFAPCSSDCCLWLGFYLCRLVLSAQRPKSGASSAHVQHTHGVLAVQLAVRTIASAQCAAIHMHVTTNNIESSFSSGYSEADIALCRMLCPVPRTVMTG